jgi:hypothetical protein
MKTCDICHQKESKQLEIKNVSETALMKTLNILSQKHDISVLKSIINYWRDSFDDLEICERCSGKIDTIVRKRYGEYLTKCNNYYCCEMLKNIEKDLRVEK